MAAHKLSSKRGTGVARRKYLETRHHAPICEQIDDLIPDNGDHLRLRGQESGKQALQVF